MNKYSVNKPSRRRFIKDAVIITGVAALPALSFTRRGFAADSAKAPKDVVKYQGTPKNRQQCSQCIYYISSTQESSQGGCKVVQGDVSANGWCMLFVAK